MCVLRAERKRAGTGPQVHDSPLCSCGGRQVGREGLVPHICSPKPFLTCLDVCLLCQKLPVKTRQLGVLASLRPTNLIFPGKLKTRNRSAKRPEESGQLRKMAVDTGGRILFTYHATKGSLVILRSPPPAPM